MEASSDGSLFALAHNDGRLMFTTTIRSNMLATQSQRAPASKSGNTGFICPLCHDNLKDLNELLSHQKQCERNRMWQKSKRFAALFASIDFVQNVKPTHSNLYLGQVRACVVHGCMQGRRKWRPWSLPAFARLVGVVVGWLGGRWLCFFFLLLLFFFFFFFFLRWNVCFAKSVLGRAHERRLPTPHSMW
jgi:hypothetical protein